MAIMDGRISRISNGAVARNKGPTNSRLYEQFSPLGGLSVTLSPPNIIDMANLDKRLAGSSGRESWHVHVGESPLRLRLDHETTRRIDEGEWY